MQLNQLLLNAHLISTPLPFPFGEMSIASLKADSREVGPFDIFVSIPCPSAPEYIQEALSKGCRVIVAEPELCDLSIFSFSEAISIPSENPRKALSDLCGVFFLGQQPDHCVAVTGTNGKSSTVHFVNQFVKASNRASASLGTLGLALENTEVPSTTFESISKGTALTTLDALRLHKLMTLLKEKEINYLALEASSHGLDQYRMHSIKIKAAAFTNLSQDHLDYHSSLQAYFEAKAKLFKEVLEPYQVAVLNKDTFVFNQLEEICKQRQHHIVTFSMHDEKANIYVSNIHVKGGSQSFDLSIEGRVYPNVSLNMSGIFQIENLMTALALSIYGLKLDEKLCIKTIMNLSAATGRLERVGTFDQTQLPIYVDYAHTPDALRQALLSLRPHTQNRLWVIFGCGGNRDIKKRPLMGEIASTLADVVIITDDNPRFEDPNTIRSQIRAGIPETLKIEQQILEIPNRSQAIEYAIAHAKLGDIVLVAGKGHETGQIIGSTTFPFDDRLEVLKNLKAHK